MFRESLPERTGMLFVFPEDAPHHFWMKNTMIPLDMIWMDAVGQGPVRLGRTRLRARPTPARTYGPDSPARQVLEIAGGLADKEKVTVGSTLKLQDLPH